MVVCAMTLEFTFSNIAFFMVVSFLDIANSNEATCTSCLEN